jgi:hypothetical protein
LTLAKGGTMKLTLAGDVVSSTLAGAGPGQPIFVVLCQDGAGGHGFAAPANLQWNTATVQDPNFCEAQGFIFDGLTAFNLSPRTFVVRGSISGLTGPGLALQLNGGTAFTIPAGAGSILFPTTLVKGQSYAVTIANQPTPQSCTVSNGSGTVVNTDVSSISVACATPSFTVGGTVLLPQGFSASQFSGITVPLTLGVSGSPVEQLNVSLTQTQFVFNTALQTGQTYSVSSPAVPVQSPGVIGAFICQPISVSGTIANANVTNIILNCSVSTP